MKKHRIILSSGMFFTFAWLCIFLVIGCLGSKDGFFLFHPDEKQSYGLNEIGDTIAGFFAPLAFVWLLIATWLQRSSLDASQEQLELLKTQVLQDRPLIDVRMSDESFTFQHEWFDGITPYMSIVNTGSAPAQIISIRRCWDISKNGNFPVAIDPDKPGDRGIEKPLPRFVGPNHKIEKVHPRFGEDLNENNFNPLPTRVFVHGFVNYRDIRGNEYISGFCHYIDPSKNMDCCFDFAWPDEDKIREFIYDYPIVRKD